MDIHDTMQEAITLVEAGKQRAFGGGVLVDKDRLLQLLNHARTALPEEVLSAASILAQRNQIIAAAQEEGGQLRAQALAEAEGLRAAAVSDAQALRSAAESEAQNLRGGAVAERESMIDDHEILREAQERADDVMARAHHQTASMRVEVDAYVDAKLAAIASTLARTLETVEAGRRKVRAQGETMVDEAIAVS